MFQLFFRCGQARRGFLMLGLHAGEIGDEFVLEQAAAVQLLRQRLELRCPLGDRSVMIAARGDERVEPRFLLGEVRVAAEAVHARLGQFDFPTEGGGRST